MKDRELIEVARNALASAYTPYSEYRVGAALLVDDGSIYTGCNVEVANYSNSVHAEELALTKAIEAGHRELDVIAVASDRRDGVTPCGMCRQSLAEFDDGSLQILCDHGSAVESYTLGDLLPAAFTGNCWNDR